MDSNQCAWLTNLSTRCDLGVWLGQVYQYQLAIDTLCSENLVMAITFFSASRVFSNIH